MGQLEVPDRSSAARSGSVGTRRRRTLRRRLIVGAVLVVLVAAPLVTGATAAGSAGPTAGGARTYVALGDSFTSGPGVPIQLGPNTRPRAPAACMRSSDDYPAVTARAVGLALRDSSCAGAATTDLTRSQGPGIPAQLTALGPSTTLVSLGIGGNDLGFSTIAANCAAATPWGGTRVGWSCASYYTADGVDRLAAAVHRVAARVARSLEEIRARAPRARVFVIGYPDVVPPGGPGCWPRLPFSARDLGYLGQVQDHLDAALAEDAAAAGDVYVDMATASAAHNSCTAAGSRWVEPIVFTSGSYPLHPSPTGMAAMAGILERAIAHPESGGRSTDRI